MDEENKENKENMESLLHNALLTLLDVKPPDPLRFLTTHFQMECDKSNYVSQAANLLQDMSTHHPAIEERMLKAYTIMSQFRVQQDVLGLTGDIYTDLLVNLTPELQNLQRDQLVQKLQCQSTEYVTFPIFQSGVHTCLLLKEYLKRAKALYSELRNESGDVPKGVCEVVLQELSKALSATEKFPSKILEIGASLSVPNLLVTLRKSVADSSDAEFLNMDTFVVEATDIFLQQIHPIK